MRNMRFWFLRGVRIFSIISFSTYEKKNSQIKRYKIARQSKRGPQRELLDDRDLTENEPCSPPEKDLMPSSRSYWKRKNLTYFERYHKNICFQQVERNCSFQEFMRKYYHFDQIKIIFTQLIRKNSLNVGLTPVDFKINNYKILNSYASHLRRLKCNLGKVESVLTSSGSSTKQARHFKEMEVQVKKMTKKIVGSKKNMQGNNNSRSFTNLLIKNIQKMLKTQKESIIGHIGLDNNIKSQRVVDRTQEQRLHTSPEPQGFDSYGLQQFREKYQRKFDQISKMSYICQHLSRSKLNSQKSQDTIRFQTEYDTQKIESKRPKSKKPDMKKSQQGRLKSTSRNKQNGRLKVIQKVRK